MFLLIWVNPKNGETNVKDFKTWEKADAYRRKHNIERSKIERAKVFA
jgi:hypothetical protein